MNNIEILLKAGKTLKVDDEFDTVGDEYSGVITHVFTSKETGTIYTIKDDDIAGFGEKLTAARLAQAIGTEEEQVAYDPMIG